MQKFLPFALIAACSVSAFAAPVNVTINGDVFFNQINNGTLSNVNSGETVAITFQLDTADFVDDAIFPTRGYAIDLSSLNVSFSGGTSIGLAPSFGGPAYFVLRNNDPAVDGFFISQGTQVDSSLPLDQVGVFGDFGIDFSVTYAGSTLDSLDIEGAEGTYAFDNGISSFNMGISDGPIDGVVGIDFASLTIEVVPTPGTAALLGLGGLGTVRRRR